MRVLIPGLLLLAALGCSDGGGAGPRSPEPDDESIALEFPDIESVHAAAIAPTCSPNGGVCHNSREYPDLHTVTTFVGQIGQPCNMAAKTAADVRDACEPEGDRLVIESLGIDAVIAHVGVSPEDAPTGELGAAIIELAGPVAAEEGASSNAGQVHRDDVAFDLPVLFTVLEPTRVQVSFRDSTDTGQVRRFLDTRTYPWQPSMVRVGDPNRNGTLGGPSVSLLQPGSPEESYLIRRLTDPDEGDLMPRQCRAWNQMATRALGCWIEGLTVDQDGLVTNPFEPIDYASCTFDPGAAGRCVDNDTDMVAAIFERRCGGAACHIGEDSPAHGLDLGADAARDDLVGVPSIEVPELLRVDPGRPDESYLHCKLVADCDERVGERMPVGGPPLSESDIEAIRRWIAAGAN